MSLTGSSIASTKVYEDQWLGLTDSTSLGPLSFGGVLKKAAVILLHLHLTLINYLIVEHKQLLGTLDAINK